MQLAQPEGPGNFVGCSDLSGQEPCDVSNLNHLVCDVKVETTEHVLNWSKMLPHQLTRATCIMWRTLDKNNRSVHVQRQIAQ